MGAHIRPLCYGLGAEVSGVDISKKLDAQSVEFVRSAFLQHSVLLFRGIPLNREQHLAFSRLFGELDNNEAVPRFRDPQYPEIMLNTNKPSDNKPEKRYQGAEWHSDRSFSCTPASASILRAEVVPNVGGDTMFANMYLAYEGLSKAMKDLIAPLYTIHPGGRRRVEGSSPEQIAEARRLSPPIAHPLVRMHPETGRPTLYLTEKIKQFVGMTSEESKPLLDFLCRHATRPQFVYRHQWRKDDLVMWDNRCLMHLAVNDYDKAQTRHMERTTVIGAPSGYVYEGPLQ